MPGRKKLREMKEGEKIVSFPLGPPAPQRSTWWSETQTVHHAHLQVHHSLASGDSASGKLSPSLFIRTALGILGVRSVSEGLENTMGIFKHLLVAINLYAIPVRSEEEAAAVLVFS